MGFTEIFSFIKNVLSQFRWQDLLDLVFVYLIIYRLLTLIRGTRAVQILTGLGMVLVVFIISDRLGFFALNYILRLFFENLLLIIIILFQDEIRRALANMGRNPFMGGASARYKAAHVLDEVVKASSILAAKRIGALIVIERQHGLKNYTEGATQVDAELSAELLLSIFHSHSPIHDGAVVIQHGKILAAGCFFQVTLETELDRNLGTRHRAAVAITRETDAVVVVMSEERGEISVVEYGELTRNLSVQNLREKLYRAFDLEEENKPSAEAPL